MLRFIDLFAGCGGLSEGFVMAGFHPIAHVEMDRYACETLETRQAYYYFKKNNKIDHYHSYLKQKITRKEYLNPVPQDIKNSVICNSISENSLNDIFDGIDKINKNRTIDVIIGGPPCQAYSLIARGRKGKEILNDKRNNLYTHYEEFIKRYRPKFVVLENVPGLLSAGSYLDDMIKLFERLDYYPQKIVPNAQDHGVLQNRRRVIIIASSKDNSSLRLTETERQPDWNLKNCVFHDLPPINPGEALHLAFYTKKASEYQTNFDLRDKSGFTTQHIARKHNERDLAIYKIAIEKWLRDKIRLKYTDLPNHLMTHNNKNSFLDRFKVVDPNGVSHTMVAHIAKDGHYYIYPSAEQIRSISVREAARIQSFPDNFYFEGPRTAVFTQIGNAVPPLLAQSIAAAILARLSHIKGG